MQSYADQYQFLANVVVVLQASPVEFEDVESDSPSKTLSNLQMLMSIAPTMKLALATFRS